MRRVHVYTPPAERGAAPPASASARRRPSRWRSSAWGLAFGAFSGLEQFEGKAFGWRLLAYPLATLVVPVGWWLAGQRPPYPYGADILITLPFLVDVTGNALDLYDSISWWDDFNHFLNWALLTGGVAALCCGRGSAALELAALAIGFGAVAAILWEFAEYFAFIRGSTRRRPPTRTRSGTCSLGLLGSTLPRSSPAVVRRPGPSDDAAGGAPPAARPRRRARARRRLDRHARAARHPRRLRRRDPDRRVGAHVVQHRPRPRRRAGGACSPAAGRELVGGVGVVVFAAASAACAVAPGFAVLLASRCVQALGAAALITASLELLAAQEPSDEEAVRAWVRAGILGAALGPAAGGIVTQVLGWEWIFALQVPAALVALAAMRRVSVRRAPAAFARAARRADQRRPRLISAALAAALFLLVLLLVNGWRLEPARPGSSSP